MAVRFIALGLSVVLVVSTLTGSAYNNGKILTIVSIIYLFELYIKEPTGFTDCCKFSDTLLHYSSTHVNSCFS